MAIQVPYPIINMVQTGQNIKRLRIEHNISVAEIQMFLGLSTPQAIYQWQAGITLPSVDHLCALSHLFGVTMNEILVLMDAPVEKNDKLIPHGKRTSNVMQHLLLFAAA